MKILHVLHQYLPEKVGGTELYTRTLARAQAERDHEVSIFTPSVAVADWPEAAVEDGVQVFRLPLGERSSTGVFQDNFRQPVVAQAFEELLKRLRPDIVHIQHLMGLPTSLVDRLRSSAIPYVVTLHDYWYICANAQLITNYDDSICEGPNWWLNCAHCALARAGRPELSLLRPFVAPIMGLRNQRLKGVLEKAACVIAPTDFVRRTYGRLGIDPGRIEVIPHGIQLPAQMPTASVRAEGPLKVVYIGGLAPQKGIHVLIEAVNGLPAEAVTLDIYGDTAVFPDYIESLESQISRPDIFLKGVLPHERLWEVLAESDVVVVPTLWFETSSLIVQEAFAAGVPVVTSDIGVLPERVRDGVDGRLFPMGEAAALRDILADFAKNPQKVASLAAHIEPVFTIGEHETAVGKRYRLALAESSAV